MRVSRIIFWGLYAIVEMLSVAYIYFIDTCVLWEWVFKPEIYHPHIILMGAYIFIINGRSMILFRLLEGSRTRVVKYVHMTLHSIVLLAGYIGYHHIAITIVLYHPAWAVLSNTKDYHFHMFMAVVVLYHLQWATGMSIFLISDQRTRKIFAPFHNFCGIVIFYIVYIMTTTRIYTLDNLFNGKVIYNTDMFCANVVAGLFTLVIILIVICPHFEWPLVGPI